MPLYYFEVRDGQDTPDKEGIVLPNLSAVRHHAVALAGRLLIDHPATFWKEEQLAVQVSDDTGLVLFTLYVDVVLAPALLPTTVAT